MSFIENLSADNLNMSEEEFQVCMGYVDGKSEADLFIQAEEEELQQSLEKLHVLKASQRTIATVDVIVLYPAVLLSGHDVIVLQSCCQGMMSYCVVSCSLVVRA